MILWVIYDIRGNRERRKVAKACKEAGLYRIQKSAFLGNIPENRVDELKMQAQELINEDHDSVYVFPTCKDDFEKVGLLGQAFDKKLVSGDIKSLVL